MQKLGEMETVGSEILAQITKIDFFHKIVRCIDFCPTNVIIMFSFQFLRSDQYIFIFIKFHELLHFFKNKTFLGKKLNSE